MELLTPLRDTYVKNGVLTPYGRRGVDTLLKAQVSCGGGLGASFFYPSTGNITLNLGNSYYQNASQNVEQLILHEYMHALIRCSESEIPKAERDAIKAIRGKNRGQTQSHCMDFKNALLRAVYLYGLLPKSVFLELHEKLNSRVWVQPYAFESRYIRPSLITRQDVVGLTFGIARQKRQKSVKQQLKVGLTAGFSETTTYYQYTDNGEIQREGKSTWRSSGVGLLVGIGFDESSLSGKERFDLVCERGYNKGLNLRVLVDLSKDSASMFPGVPELRDIRRPSSLPKAPLSERDFNSAEVFEKLNSEGRLDIVEDILSAIRPSFELLHEICSGAAWLSAIMDVCVCEDFTYGAQTSGNGDTYNYKCMLMFKPEILRTLYVGLSDASIDYVAAYTLIFNQITGLSIDYSTLNPLQYRSIQSFVDAKFNSLDPRLKLLTLMPFNRERSYGGGYCDKDAFGHLISGKDGGFWHTYAAEKLAAGRPVHIPGFFVSFGDNVLDTAYDGGFPSRALTWPDGGSQFYKYHVEGGTPPQCLEIDSPIGVYSGQLDILTDMGFERAVDAFVDDLLGSLGGLNLGSLQVLSGSRRNILASFSELLCYISTEVRLQSSELSQVYEGFIGLEAPYDAHEFIELRKAASANFLSTHPINIEAGESEFSEDALRDLLKSKCPTMRILLTEDPDSVCVLLATGKLVSTFELSVTDVNTLPAELEAIFFRGAISNAFGSIDFGHLPRANYARSLSARVLSAGDVDELLGLNVMSFGMTGEVNLLEINPADYPSPYDILLDLKEIPTLKLREIEGALGPYQLVVVNDPSEGFRYYYRSGGESMEIPSVIAWWLLYI
jgi:hypothetical protein